VGWIANIRLQRSCHEQFEKWLLLDEVGKERRFIPRAEDGTPKTGFSDNWWLGVEMLHTLFALEHNAICDKIRKGHPNWTGYVPLIRWWHAC
jgi:hypothetical protein